MVSLDESAWCRWMSRLGVVGLGQVSRLGVVDESARCRGLVGLVSCLWGIGVVFYGDWCRWLSGHSRLGLLDSIGWCRLGLLDSIGWCRLGLLDSIGWCRLGLLDSIGLVSIGLARTRLVGMVEHASCVECVLN